MVSVTAALNSSCKTDDFEPFSLPWHPQDVEHRHIQIAQHLAQRSWYLTLHVFAQLFTTAHVAALHQIEQHVGPTNHPLGSISAHVLHIHDAVQFVL